MRCRSGRTDRRERRNGRFDEGVDLLKFRAQIGPALLEPPPDRAFAGVIAGDGERGVAVHDLP